MGGIGYSIFGATGLISLGSYNLFAAIYTFLKSQSPSSPPYSAKPYHPFPPSSSTTMSMSMSIWGIFKQQLVLYLVMAWLGICILHDCISAFDSDPLLKGSSPVHRFSSLHSSSVLLLFLLLPLSLLLLLPSSSSSLDHRLSFSLLSASFFLQSSSSSSSSASFQTSLLQAHLSSVSARVSFLSSLLCLSLAFNPRLFPADVALWSSLLLQGLWTLQTGLSLHVDAFIPDGCHRLLDVSPGVDGSTRCDLDDSRLRAVAILDLLFVLYVLLVFLVVLTTYALVARAVGGASAGAGSSAAVTPKSRMGSYEALPTSDLANNINHSIQMKTLTGTQA